MLPAQSARPPYYPGSITPSASSTYLGKDLHTSGYGSPAMSGSVHGAGAPGLDGNVGAAAGGEAWNERLDDAYADEYGRKLELIERVRHEVELDDDVRTPGIVVLGSQSAGKSSVLARLTGISFPTGENMCTRTPIIVHTAMDPSVRGFRAEVSGDAAFADAVRCGSQMQLRDEIAALTARVAREAGSVVDAPIYVRHTRRAGPVMTLIDLPGITHLDPANDGYDIHGATTAVVRAYARDDSLIMLVVIPATDDFANSEALRLAQEYDARGERTVGVVSKCDLLPHACDIVDKVNMTRTSDIKLALGFVALRNRARGDAPSDDVDDAERRLFATHPQLRRLRPAQRGIHALTARVVALQGSAVDRFFSLLRSQLWDAKRALKARLDAVPETPATPEARRDVLIDVLAAIHARVSALVHTDDVTSPQLNIPARTHEMCARFGADIVRQMPNCLHASFIDAVRTKQAEARGRLLPDAEVDTVIAQQVRELLFGGPTARARGGVVQRCTDDLVNAVMMFMVRCYEVVITDETERANFPSLAAAICSQLGAFIERARKHAAQITGAILAAERSICYTQNALYIGAMREVRRVATTINAADDTQRKAVVSKLLQRDNINTNGNANANANAANGAANIASGGDDNGNDPGKLLKNCPMLSVAPALFPQDNVAEEDYISFLDRFIAEAALQSDTWSLMRAQFSIHCYLHVVMKRLCDVIPMVVRNVLVYQLHAGFLPDVSKALLKDTAVLEDAMKESNKERESRKSLEAKYAKLDDVLTKMLELGLEKESNGKESTE